MPTAYKLFYPLGFHPWEDLADHPPFAEKLAELLAARAGAETSSPAST